MTQMLIKSPQLVGLQVTLPVIDATLNNAGSALTAARVRLTDVYSTGDTQAYVSYDDREADGSVALLTSIFSWAGVFPVTSGDYWFRVVDVGSVDVIRILHNSISYNFDDEVQMTHEPLISLNVPAIIPFPDSTQTGHVYLDICANDGGAPDGNWVRRELLFMNTTTGAEPEMNWWGDLLVVEDVSTSPQPQFTFLEDAGSGPAGQCNVEYTTQTGLTYARWYRDTPQTYGDFEVWMWVESDPDASVVIKDYLGNTISHAGGTADFELVGATAYLDMSGASVDDEYTAEIYVFSMNTNDSWREVLRRVTLYGKKTA